MSSIPLSSTMAMFSFTRVESWRNVNFLQISCGSAAVAMTTTCEPEITSTKEVVSSLIGTNTLTSSAQSVMKFYFSCAAIFIGVVGTATNGLVIYALVASMQQRRPTYFPSECYRPLR